MQLKGLFITNAFLRGAVYDRIRQTFSAAAESEHVTLEHRTNAEVLALCGDGIVCRGVEDADFVIFYDKDLRLAQALSATGKRLFNTASAIEACDDKSLTHILLSRAGIPQPKTLLCPKTFAAVGYTDLTFLESAEKELGYPMIIKERYGSLGEQVYLAADRDSAERILRSLNGAEALLQECVTVGRDLRINIVGGRYLGAMERSSDSDFRANIARGGHSRRAEATADEIALALKSCEALGLDFAGVDILWRNDGTPVVCEVNSNAHTNGFFECTGINVAEHIMRHIKESLK